MVSGFLSCFELKLTLAELGSATGSLEAVLLTLFHTRISGQVSGGFQDRSEIGVNLKKRSCDAVTDCACLAGKTAALDIYKHIELVSAVRCNQGLTNNNLQSLKTEILVDVSLIDGNLAGSRHQIYSGYR